MVRCTLFEVHGIYKCVRCNLTFLYIDFRVHLRKINFLTNLLSEETVGTLCVFILFLHGKDRRPCKGEETFCDILRR
jgi:hypothetical protein